MYLDFLYARVGLGDRDCTIYMCIYIYIWYMHIIFKYDIDNVMYIYMHIFIYAHRYIIHINLTIIPSPLDRRKGDHSSTQLGTDSLRGPRSWLYWTTPQGWWFRVLMGFPMGPATPLGTPRLIPGNEVLIWEMINHHLYQHVVQTCRGNHHQLQGAPLLSAINGVIPTRNGQK